MITEAASEAETVAEETEAAQELADGMITEAELLAQAAAITADNAEDYGSCSADLNWYYKDRMLVIRGTGPMEVYAAEGQAPWFSYAKTMYYVVIEDGCTKISNTAFSAFLSLVQVVIPESVTEIGSSAFRYTYRLTHIDLPSGLTVIEGLTFQKSGLKSIVIPEGVTRIGINAFQYCGDLAEVKLPSTLTTIEANAFAGTPVKNSIKLP
ncbi:MAG: leucine-rich repeat domain-containing protein [Clostridiales bacterium]|nr:leucine-rich repeat domain-containing protein [Clostridiales bacterium]